MKFGRGVPSDMKQAMPELAAWVSSRFSLDTDRKERVNALLSADKHCIIPVSSTRDFRPSCPLYNLQARVVLDIVPDLYRVPLRIKPLNRF